MIEEMNEHDGLDLDYITDSARSSFHESGSLYYCEGGGGSRMHTWSGSDFDDVVLSPSTSHDSDFTFVNNNHSTRMKIIPSAITPQTRHARRIYVGGIPAAHCDEEALKSFINSVICKGLGDDGDSSYVLSIYVHQQKCFAFVELNSIELTTACLELDGIIYRSTPLKVTHPLTN